MVRKVLDTPGIHHTTKLGKEITLARLERLLGPKVMERLEVAAMREHAMGIIPVSQEELARAVRFIKGESPKAEGGMHGERLRYQDRTIFTRVASKYFMENGVPRHNFVKWAEALVTTVESNGEGKKRGKKKH